MIDLRGLDLNLLVILQGLLEERSISAVARRLDLSQPAVSNALRRLRVALDDELFVRSANTMQPTPLAERLAEPVGEALSLLSHMLDFREAFDPAAGARRFRVAMSDVGEIHFMPRLLARCAADAPGVRIDSVRLAGTELRRDMEAGRVDLAIGAFAEDMGSGFFQRQLFQQGYLTLHRPGMAGVGEGMSRAAFVAQRHLIVSRALPYGQINTSLERAGVVLDAHFSVPHFGAVPYIVASNDVLATVPEKLAQSVAERFGLATFTPPLRVAPLQTRLFWPRRLHRDAANQWLRERAVQLFAGETA
ncbi:LysR family transcriptional regulator [Achromobacter sp. GG226]|uniref:LysR substrate-binding domain-containing protein n=1 Tax=Verticiella alkaliphila TaxID=2779529 RepID=UPI001C0B1FFA|nr:LysR substrate-binding domain-containing protein [Verticiella sp. GG226]MBU4611563.1 LysR family transcriptional regulator [Verticiella sp. GG226]